MLMILKESDFLKISMYHEHVPQPDFLERPLPFENHNINSVNSAFTA